MDGVQRWYAGIGSRETPPDMLAMIEDVAEALARMGWGLRSGGARGADSAFEVGAGRVDGPMEIFLPTARRDVLHGIDASSLPVAGEARRIAQTLHPAWHRLDGYVQRLMARNVNQVLGPCLDDPVRFVLCWAKGSRLRDGHVVDVDGGTGLAVRLAASRGIEVFNLHERDHRLRVESMVETALHDHHAGPAP